MRNVLIVGLGSIGQRHFRNLKSIDKKIIFYASRKKRISPKLDNKNKVLRKKFDCRANDIQEIDLAKAKKYKIDTAFVSNPTSEHLKTALNLAKMGCNLFIEKPLSHKLTGVKKLLKIVNSKKIKCEIGFQTRYDDLLIAIKKIIISKKYGDIKKASISHRHYLPYHHKYEDYKKGYAARKDLGGGVLLCFAHEIDYASYLFGKVKRITTQEISSEKNLDIKVETSAIFTLFYGEKKIPVFFNLDFLKKKNQRKCEIKFEKAILIWDLNENKIEIYDGRKKTIKSKIRTRNGLFLKSLKKVYTSFKANKNSLNTLANAAENLKIIINIKKKFGKVK